MPTDDRYAEPGVPTMPPTDYRSTIKAKQRVGELREAMAKMGVQAWSIAEHLHDDEILPYLGGRLKSSH